MDIEEQEDLLQEMLSEGYFYKFDLEQNNLQEIKFCVEKRVNIDSQTNVKQFSYQLNESTGCTFNVQTGRDLFLQLGA